MRVMVIVKATGSSEAGEMPDQQRLTEMGKFNESLVEAGIMQAGEGLKPSSEGVRIRFSGTERTIMDGPFAETRELIAGYWMWEVSSMEEAIEWGKRCPNPMAEDSDIEIRPVFEADDFGEDYTPELREQEDAIRARTEDTDEAEIRRLIAHWSRALEVKDVDGLTANYAPDAVLYDAIPPYKAVGVDSIRKVWECCLPHIPEVKSVHRDLTFHITEDMAIVHGLHNFQTETEHPCSQSWIRVTVCYRRLNGAWKVVHEHASVPFNPMDDQAWEIADPDALTTPDYGQPPTKD